MADELGKKRKVPRTERKEKRVIGEIVDPTAVYINKIAHGDELSVNSGIALEEVSGREVELLTGCCFSTHVITILENCSLDHLCAFLKRCAIKLAVISSHMTGSHIAIAALKSLVTRLKDDENCSLIGETLSVLCQEIVRNPDDMICNMYGSHVVVTILCLCKGLDIVDPFHLPVYRPETPNHRPFPDQLNFLIREMLNPSNADVRKLRVNPHSSLVLQVALRLLAGQKEELYSLIARLLSCNATNILEGNFIEREVANEIKSLVEENAFSHLMEAMLAVAPDSLYNEFLTKVFKDFSLRMSLHPSATFVVRALINNIKTSDHVKFIFNLLGSRFWTFFKSGRAGVVSCLIGASIRRRICQLECAKAVADAVCVEGGSIEGIVPRILFLTEYIHAHDRSNWNWPSFRAVDSHGFMILHSIFSFPSKCIQVYTTSLIALEARRVLEIIKYPKGARLIGRFLRSEASAEQKIEIVMKLLGHFGELSRLDSSSDAVEKCFSISNMPLKRVIVSEILPFEAELSKTVKGRYLLEKLDVARFSREPDQWILSQRASGQSAQKTLRSKFHLGTTKPKKSGSKINRRLKGGSSKGSSQHYVAINEKKRRKNAAP